MRSPLALVMAMLLAVGGCIDGVSPEPTGTASPSENPSATNTTTSATSSTSFDASKCPYGAHWPPQCDWPTASLGVYVEGGAVGVPFPHLDRCLSWQVWMTEATGSSHEATARLENTTRGPVYWVDPTGDSQDGRPSAHLTLNTTDHPECQTFRYDPWSIEPDAANETLEVYAPGPVDRVSIYISWGIVCGYHLMYEATDLQAGWTSLEPKRGSWCK